jgi:phosphate transport system substrate-binding protein
MQRSFGSARRLVTVLVVMAACFALNTAVVWADQLRLVGSGASFPYPLYSTWFKTFSKANPDILVDYQSKGSGAGIKDFISKTVDFGASDAAMTDEEMAQVPGGVQLLPMTAGSIVLAYNILGVPEGLKLSREVYSKIFMGEIKKWNDPLIARDNPDVKLPDLDITVVRRADASGTTFVFTQHLSAISEAWKKAIGHGTTVNWPSSDKIVAANDKSEAEALAKATLANSQDDMPENLRRFFPDPPGENSYPMVTYSWILLYGTYPDAKKATALKDFVTWGITAGQQYSEDLGFISLPPHIRELGAKAVAEVQ